MKKNINYAIFVLFLVSVIFGLIVVFQTRNGEKVQAKYKKNKIAIVELTGEIFFADTVRSVLKKDVEYYVSRLNSLFKRNDVKGIVLKINSPGGSVAAVQRLYNQIMKLKYKYKKPIVCYVPELCVSGGYYVATACDKIICAEGSVVGSIGVILQVGNISGLLKKIGVNVEVVKSSKYKDIGSPFREMLPEERKIFEDLVNTAYEQFINAIKTGRNLTKEEVLKFADGGIYISTKALQLKMIDAIGDEDTAIEEVKSLAKLEGEVEVLRERISFIDLFRQVAEDRSLEITKATKFLQQKFAFEYILY